jgi:hypothetical protein
MWQVHYYIFLPSEFVERWMSWLGKLAPFLHICKVSGLITGLKASIYLTGFSWHSTLSADKHETSTLCDLIHIFQFVSNDVTSVSFFCQSDSVSVAVKLLYYCPVSLGSSLNKSFWPSLSYLYVRFACFCLCKLLHCHIVYMLGLKYIICNMHVYVLKLIKFL